LARSADRDQPLGKYPVSYDGEVTVARVRRAIIDTWWIIRRTEPDPPRPTAASALAIIRNGCTIAEGCEVPDVNSNWYSTGLPPNPAPWHVSDVDRRIAATVTNAFIATQLSAIGFSSR